MKRLSVQALESRKLLAANIAMLDTTLHIEGTSDNDVAEVYTVEDSVMVKVQSGDSEAVEQSFPADQVDGIIFEAFAGDDLLINDTSIDSIMRAGGGNDTVLRRIGQ